jgi:two-component system nitrogen regulation sensor histidine kinase NtrY
MVALIALIVLLSAVWFGLTLADRLVAPVRRLIHATDQVATGNFYVQVPIRGGEGGPRPSRRNLQQDDRGAQAPARRLTAASELIDRRRRFTETVLAACRPA